MILKRGQLCSVHPQITHCRSHQTESSDCKVKNLEQHSKFLTTSSYVNSSSEVNPTELEFIPKWTSSLTVQSQLIQESITLFRTRLQIMNYAILKKTFGNSYIIWITLYDVHLLVLVVSHIIFFLQQLFNYAFYFHQGRSQIVLKAWHSSEANSAILCRVIPNRAY